MKQKRNRFAALRTVMATASLAAALAVAPPAGRGGAAQAGEAADLEKGAKLWRQCRSCHSIGDDARHRVGPHLNGLFGRRAGSAEGYRYSKDMLRAGADGLTWSAETLDVFIENPKALVTGSRMAFRGIKDPEARRDLTAWLRSFSANPADIPESAPTAAPRCWRKAPRR